MEIMNVYSAKTGFWGTSFHFAKRTAAVFLFAIYAFSAVSCGAFSGRKISPEKQDEIAEFEEESTAGVFRTLVSLTVRAPRLIWKKSPRLSGQGSIFPALPFWNPL
jgi:hypothetical protein